MVGLSVREVGRSEAAYLIAVGDCGDARGDCGDGETHVVSVDEVAPSLRKQLKASEAGTGHRFRVSVSLSPAKASTRREGPR